MEECHKEYAELCEIHVRGAYRGVCNEFRDDLSIYDILRFGFLASSWLPRPVGFLLWSLLNLTIVVLFLVLIFPWVVILSAATLGLLGLIAVAADYFRILRALFKLCISCILYLPCLCCWLVRTPVRTGGWPTLSFREIMTNWRGDNGWGLRSFWRFVKVYFCPSAEDDPSCKDFLSVCKSVVFMNDAIAI